MASVIVNIRGTGGSGKSWIVRAIMARMAGLTPVFEGPAPQDLFGGSGSRRQCRPIGYAGATPSGQLWVAGHYDVQSGGADRLLGAGWTRDEVHAMVRDKDDAGVHVLYEGLILSDVARAVELQGEGRRVVVINLTTTLEECLAATNERRAQRGETDPVSTVKTTQKFKEMASQAARLRAAGVDVRDLDRQAALATTLAVLGW